MNFVTTMPKKPQPLSLGPGTLLVSEPFLQDENFMRSVVLLCDHQEVGSFGLVLNKLSILTLDEVLEEIPLPHIPVFVGGPVEQNTLHFIYKSKHKFPGGIRLGEDVYWGGDFDLVVKGLLEGQIDEACIRFFIGYSGWSAGQLDQEVRENTWIVTNAIGAECLFEHTSDELWRYILKHLGGEFKQMANYPIDPRLN